MTATTDLTVTQSGWRQHLAEQIGGIPTGIVILNWMCHGQGLDLIILIINLNFHAPPPTLQIGV